MEVIPIVVEDLGLIGKLRRQLGRVKLFTSKEIETFMGVHLWVGSDFEEAPGHQRQTLISVILIVIVAVVMHSIIKLNY